VNWVVLLIIGLASLAFVIGAFAYVVFKAWRLIKRGLSISREIAPLAEHLSRQAEVLQANADRVAGNSDEITANLERLRASTARLQILWEAFSEAMVPYRKVRDYLGG